MEQRNIESQSQQTTQTLTPQQVLEVRLLELPTLGLEERIKAELLDNPALAVDEGDAEGEDAPYQDEEGNAVENDNSRAADYLNEDEIPDFMEPTPQRGAAEIPFAETASFYEEMNRQIGELRVGEQTKRVVAYLIGSLDDDGLLRKPLPQIRYELSLQEGLTVSETYLEQVLSLLQSLDPPGIAAQSLQECLLIQLRRNEQTPHTRLAIKVVLRYYDDFTHKAHEKLRRRLNVDETTYQQVWDELMHLNPRPGNALGEPVGRSLQEVTPDFIVETTDDGTLAMNLNNSNIPELRIHPEYVALLETYTKQAAKNKQMREAALFIKQKNSAAQGFIDAIKVRNQTMYRTMKAIVTLQKSFFMEGDERALKPMTLKDIADITGYDVSTISRVTNSKYVQTNYNIYPLKFFFTVGYTNHDGEERSAREIRKLMLEAIDGESKSSPLTDEQLMAVLQEKGFAIARRTIAKYREQLGIPVARMRREIN